MRPPTSEELALQAEVGRLRERIAELEKEGQAAETLAAQRHQREFLATLLAQAPFGVAVHKGRDLRYELVNPAYQAMAGAETPLVGRMYREVFPDSGAPEAELLKVLDTGEPRVLTRFRAPVPGKPNAVWSSQVVRLPAVNGDEPRLLGLVWDVTELAGTEAALRESEARYRALVTATSDAVCRMSPDWKKMFYLHGRSFLADTDEPTATWLQKYVHPDDRQFVTAVIDEAIRTRSTLELEHRVLRADGSLGWTHSRAIPVLDGDGEIVEWFGTASDITNRKQAEEALRESQKQLLSIYDTVRDVIFHLAVEGGDQFRFVSVNAAFLRMTGLSREAVVGKTVREVIPEPSLTMVLEKYRQALRQKSMVSWEETSDYPTGRLTGEVSVAPVLDRNGICTHLVGSVHDITESHQAQAALRESEERFRGVADSAPVMIWVAGPDKLCTFFNQPWLEFRGRKMAEEIGNGWAEGVHPEDMERCLATYHSSFDVRQSFRMEYRLLRADGEYRWLLDSGTPRYREGEFIGYIGSCIDITEQKRVEDELRSNQAQLMDSQRLAKVGSWDREIATGQVRWSDEMYRIYGLPKGTRMDFPTFLNRVHQKDRAMVADVEKKALESKAPFEMELRGIRPNGELRFIRAMIEAVKNDDGSLVRLVGATQDVTEQVKATELLRESEARLRNAERMTHVGNWIWDIKANRASWSEEIARILGQPPDYAPGYEELLQLVVAEDRKRIQQWGSDCLAGKRGSAIEVRIVRPGGDVRTVACTSEVMLDEDGSPERMFGACQDVTDARRAQEESFARQKLESLGTLASGIAHDFNNLLGAVLAQAELATAEIESGCRPDDELKQIRDVAVRGAEIVRQLMIYAGKESDVLEPVDVSKAVGGMLGLLKVSLSRHATLVTHLEETLPAVKARSAQIRQIVMNLVVNASDALEDRDGVIRVSTGRVRLAGDAVEARSDGLDEGEYVQLEVSDSGCGMSPETQTRIFDPFFTTKTAGRGLGLPVVYGIVRGLGGAIRVASEVGKGTTFQVLLPTAVTAAEPEGDSAAADHRELRSQGTVLVVEDEDPLRLAVQKMLGRAGFTVLEAADGSEAVQLLRREGARIDLLFLDLTIPGRSSHEVLSEAVRVCPRVKVILTSAYSEEMARASLDASRVHGFVRKPYQFATVVSRLRDALSS